MSPVLLQDTSRIMEISVLSGLLLQLPFLSLASLAPCLAPFWDGPSWAVINWPLFFPQLLP